MASTATDNHASLHFFGKVSASISHEIKNVFAVINEAAGLLGDLTLMAERGMDLDPERLKKVATSIQGQVQRGDGIVKNMNRLAHCTDEISEEVELSQIVELVVALSGRMADMKQMGVAVGECCAARVVISPFHLIQLLHGVVALSLDKMAPKTTLVLAVEEREGVPLVRFSVPGEDILLSDDGSLKTLAADMGMVIVANKQDGTLELEFKRAA